MKKSFITLCVSLASTLLLAACAGGISVNESATKSTSPTTLEGATSDEDVTSDAVTTSVEDATSVEDTTTTFVSTEDTGKDFVGTLVTEPAPAGEEHPILHGIDFSLRDQSGQRHSLADYKGKIVILNFWQTWCPPCKEEMPDFQRAYEKYGENREDIVILGIASPKNELNTVYQSEQMSDQEIGQFLEDGEYSYPTLMDYTADLYIQYEIRSFPTTVIMRPDHTIFGYVPGALNEAYLDKMINDVKAEDTEG